MMVVPGRKREENEMEEVEVGAELRSFALNWCITSTLRL